MILLSRLVMLIAVVILLVFCMSNLEPVTVRMVGWESPQMPLFLIVMFVFFFGFFLALFWQALRGVTRKKESKPTPAAIPEPESKNEKKERRWRKKKQDVKDKGATGEAVAGKKDSGEQPVDKGDEKVNITEESTDTASTEK